MGRCDKYGKDAVNELSYLMLDATEELGFVCCLSIRFSSGTDRAFLKRALEVVAHVQKGIPFFFNYDVMIPALVYGGISFEDARDYTQIGCVEMVIQGKSNPHAVTGEVNFLKALEYALEDGKSIMNPQVTPGTKTGNPDKFNTFEKLEAAVNVRLLHIVDVCCGEIVNATEHMVSVEPKPYKSLLFGGIPNLADRLRVRHFVQ